MDVEIATITKIEIQKRNKGRCAIFLDHEFAFGLDAAIVVQHGLKAGDQITQVQISEILYEEEKQRIKEQVYRFLARRAHSEKELRTKLLRKRFEKSLVEAVILELERQKLVDDAAFAHAFVHSRLRSKPLGEHALRQELRNKGLAETHIASALQKAYDEKSQVDYARDLIQKKMPHYEEFEDRIKKKRLADFLVRRGFDWELVKEVLEEKFRAED